MLLLSFFVETTVLNVNSTLAGTADPDLTPQIAASDLGLQCLSISHLYDSRHKWVYDSRHKWVNVPYFHADNNLFIS